MNGSGTTRPPRDRKEVSTGMGATMRTKVCTACKQSRSLRQFVGDSAACQRCANRSPA